MSMTLYYRFCAITSFLPSSPTAKTGVFASIVIFVLESFHAIRFRSLELVNDSFTHQYFLWCLLSTT